MGSNANLLLSTWKNADTKQARALMPILERKAGLLQFNGLSTDMEVANAMVHICPYPASGNFGAASAGIHSIRRFVHSVCYQNLPQGCLADAIASIGAQRATYQGRTATPFRKVSTTASQWRSISSGV